MKSVVQLLMVLLLVPLVTSCDGVTFHSKKAGPTSEDPQGCEPNCQPGPCVPPKCDPTVTYTWFEGGFGMCNKACGGGEQTQVVECRRMSDNVVVADSLCSGTKPASTRTCNVQACPSPTYNWNIGAWSECSKTCGGGTRTRTVVCQNNSGQTVADSNCTAPKPETSSTCNTDQCSPTYTYTWQVTAGTCSKPCGSGTATDVVVCRRSDGTNVADSFCNAATKPPTTRTCNTQECPVGYTYAWEPSAWSVCSKECGDGVQTRSIACKRSDGAYVAESFCSAVPKPSTQQACKIKDCPAGTRDVTQVEYVTPALNQVDVVLIIDDSSSMKADQTKLATRMSGLISDLDSLKIDYQVCLTTTDIGYYKGGPIKWNQIDSYILKPSTPNKHQVFTTTIDALGADYSSDEQGIKALHLMIRDFKGSGCLRNNSTLTAILVSDENERSVGGNQSWSSAQYKPLTPENYPDNLIQLVRSTYNTSSFTKPFVYNSVIVKPGDRTCEAQQDAQSSPSFFGTLYAELSNKTGGHINSICDSDYTNALKLIKNRVVNSMPGITLQCTPIGTPTVTFSPNVTTTISVTGNTMKFTPNIPEGVKVTITYSCPL